MTVLPRGDLQVAQPSNVGEQLVRLYSRGFPADDRLTWRSIVQGRPATRRQCWSDQEFASTPYFKEWMQPGGLLYVASAPLSGPVLSGYPGAIHVCRSEAQGPFTPDDLQKLAQLAAEHSERAASAREAQRSPACEGVDPLINRPNVQFVIVTGEGRWVYPNEKHKALDDRLREQMLEEARNRTQRINGDSVTTSRVLLPDSRGDNWAWRVVTYKRYPALGEGVFHFFCLQPDCGEWAQLRASDVQADQDLTRLMPALRFMQDNFTSGPTLLSIAKTAELSPFHFHRRFTELFGMTPKQFLLECQINQAKRELLSEEKELAQIAKDCGFAHQSHFTSRFKQATGLTPTRWRRVATERGKTSEN